MMTPQFENQNIKVPVQRRPVKSSQRPGAAAGLSRHLGNRIQAKLNISQPNDRFERQADQAAAAVTQGKQAPCHCGGVCPKCQGEKSLQRKPETTARSGHTARTATDSFVSRLGNGRPMDRTTQGFFGTRFGYDFSNVRIHQGAAAAQSARTLNARAYTYGQDIVFGKNQYQPGTMAGRYLLAHELAHVIQQNGDTQHAGGRAGPMIQRTTDASFESATGLDQGISNGTVVIDSNIMGNTYTAEDCMGTEDCNINFKFEKACKGVYPYRAANRDVKGIYVKIVARYDSSKCGNCSTLRLIQTVRNITENADGDIITADPGSAVRRERSGWGDQNAPSRGWRVDRLTSATNPFYTSGSNGTAGNSSSPAILWDAPGNWANATKSGKEFQTCAVCDEGGVRKVLACVNWGYYINDSGTVNFRPAIPVPSCGATRQLRDAAARWDAISGNQDTDITF